MFSFIYDQDFSLKGEHNFLKPTFEAYESPERIRAIWRYLHSRGLFTRKDIQVLNPTEITKDHILQVHSPYLVQTVQNLSKMGQGEIGRWVKANSDTYSLALKSAGAVAKLLEVISGNPSRREGPFKKSNVGFALNRPPGHHASRDMTEGFCVFNNVAIAIQYLRDEYGFDDRVAIIDIDAHFGNGTSSLFYDDPDVLSISIHESSFLGVRGMPNEIGTGPGAGTNINYQVPFNTTNELWLHSLNVIEQIMAQFMPKFLIVSAGFDAHWTDPMANLLLTTKAYETFGRWINELSSKVCQGRIGFVLEGGYSLLILGQLVEALITPFLNDFIPTPYFDLFIDHEPSPEKKAQIQRLLTKQENNLQSLLEPYWLINLE